MWVKQSLTLKRISNKINGVTNMQKSVFPLPSWLVIVVYHTVIMANVAITANELECCISKTSPSSSPAIKDFVLFFA